MVSAVNQALLRERFGERHVSRLAMGVHAGVCAARAVDLKWVADEVADRIFYDLLDRQSIFLPLPASVGSSAIGQSQSIFHLEETINTKKGPQIAR